jgi:M6 family metalloprotease-like protein
MPAPFYGKRFVFTQPDGSQLEVRGFGNQFRARFETLDGDPVVRDPATGFHEAVPAHAARSALVLAGARAAGARPALPRQTRWQERRAEKKRTRRAGPEAEAALVSPEEKITGDYVGLCLLVRFPDDVGDAIPEAEVATFCNRRGYDGFGNNGSVYDYFFDNSGGELRYTNVVAPYYRARQPRAYYTDPAVRWPDRTQELILEALYDLQAQGFDFRGLTADGAGFVHALNVFYTGTVTNEFQAGLWPHSSDLVAPIEVAPGRTIRDYQITDMGEKLTLGTFCHENGHMVCDFPDLYDLGEPTDCAADSYGTGYYCLMGYGGDADSTNPTQICAYLKYRAGWAPNVTPITPGREVSLAAGRNEFALYERSATEYFILEARRKEGRDAALPDAGLAIWHVDEDSQASNEHEQRTRDLHYECLEQADGRFGLEIAQDLGDPYDLFPITGNDQFGDATLPDSRWWDGTPSKLEIRRIRRAGNGVTFVSE